MGLGLGANIREYKDPETLMPRTRRARSAASSNWMGHSIDLDGSSEYMYLVSTNVGYSQDYLSIQIVFKSDVMSATESLISFANTDGSRTCGLFTKSSRLCSYARDTGHATTTGYNGWKTGILSSDTWYHAVVTVDWTAPIAKIYLNGVHDTTGTHTDAVFRSPSYVGKAEYDQDGSITTTHFNGHISQIATWRRIITANEIKGLYAGGHPRSALNVRKNLFSYYPIIANDNTSGTYPNQGTPTFNMRIFHAGLGVWRGGFATGTYHGDYGSMGRGALFINTESSDVVNEYMGE